MPSLIGSLGVIKSAGQSGSGFQPLSACKSGKMPLPLSIHPRTFNHTPDRLLPPKSLVAKCMCFSLISYRECSEALIQSVAAMTPKTLHSQVALGEDSKRQFKADVRNADSLAAEMAAFANSDGGKIFIGVADDGSVPGLGPQDVSRINQIFSNAANQLVRSPFAVQSAIRYHGLGSSINRALEQWPRIEFFDDHDGRLFRVTVTRKPVEELDLVETGAPESRKSSLSTTRRSPAPTRSRSVRRRVVSKR